MKNITITMPEKLARWARVKAAEQDKSLSRFIADFLGEEMRRESGYAAALKRFRTVKPVRLREPGEKLPTRDELYDRKVLRR